jgi:hypothetical protein
LWSSNATNRLLCNLFFFQEDVTFVKIVSQHFEKKSCIEKVIGQKKIRKKLENYVNKHLQHFKVHMQHRKSE